MTIYLYSGTPGSGKSLHATRDIRDYLKYKKCDVISNYGVKVDEKWKGRYHYCPNGELQPASLVLFAVDYWNSGTRRFAEDSLLLVIDECQLIFNSRTWADSDRLNWIEFFSQHRKYGYKIIFIAQSDGMIDKQIRAVIEYEVNHRKIGNFGIFGKLLSVPFKNLFIAVTRYYTMSERLGAEWFRYSKAIARMYNSYDTFTQARLSPPQPRSGGGDLSPAVFRS